MPDPPPTNEGTGNPVVLEESAGRSLCFEDGTLQSRMIRDAPGWLVLEYTRLMMGFLLFQPAPARIAMIGLGGGSLAKYCGRKLPRADFTAVEVSPEVIALRRSFEIPPDGPRFRILCADGAEFVRGDMEPLDVLLVDAFDRRGQPEQLCTPAFYDDCRERLGDGGVLIVNLYADDSDCDSRVERIRESFAGKIAVIEAEESANKIVFAGSTTPFPPAFPDLVERLHQLEESHPVGLDVTARKLLESTGRRALSGRERRRMGARRRRP